MNLQTPLPEPSEPLSLELAERFVEISLACLHREYPNVVLHVMDSDADALTPRAMKPAFFGCLDWHSAVHNHWALLRLSHWLPDARFVPRIVEALSISLTEEHIAGELRYIDVPSRLRFEMPYGMAWLLQLAAELREQPGEQAGVWLEILEPLEQLARDRFARWLTALPTAILGGEHSQSAFAMGLAWDWAVTAGDDELRRLIAARSRAFYLSHRDWPFGLEPSAYDFLSAGLAEADLLRRILEPEAFAAWLDRFLPVDRIRSGGDWLQPVLCADASEGKLSHWEGLNLSRAWMLEGIAAHTPDAELSQALKASAARHRQAGLQSVTGEHYAGAHWLVSFAVYLLTGRGRRPGGGSEV